MADKKLNALSVVNNAKYAYLEDGNGNQVKMEMSTLASVVGGLRYMGILDKTHDFHTFLTPGFYRLFNSSGTNNPGFLYGYLLVLSERTGNDTVQLAISLNGDIRACGYWAGSQKWTDWK